MNKNQMEQASAIACTTLERCNLMVFLYRHQVIIYTAPSFIVHLTPIKFTSDGLSLPSGVQVSFEIQMFNFCKDCLIQIVLVNYLVLNAIFRDIKM